MTDAEYSELVGKPDEEPEQAALLWGEGSDLHYAWYGMTAAEFVRILRNTIADIEGGGAENVETRGTRH